MEDSENKTLSLSLIVILIFVIFAMIGAILYLDKSRSIVNLMHQLNGDTNTQEEVVIPTPIPQQAKVVCARYKDIDDALNNINTACILDLSDQNLSELPKNIVKLKKLNQIVLNDNYFKTFPTVLLSISSLIEIDLVNNQISSLPTDINKLTNLQNLDMTNNELTSIPNTIGKLNNMYYLKLKGNNINPSEQSKIKALFPNREDSPNISITF